MTERVVSLVTYRSCSRKALDWGRLVSAASSGWGGR